VGGVAGGWAGKGKGYVTCAIKETQLPQVVTAPEDQTPTAKLSNCHRLTSNTLWDWGQSSPSAHSPVRRMLLHISLL